ncbi:MAG: HEPN domain-containing protein [Chloroflexi bacterium]|nr:HEPN domain-containing protein [Chloroflexota bacterium]
MADPETREVAEEWLAFAREDLAITNLAGASNRIRCFHAQQAAEKGIKALLTLLEIEFVRSHDLNYLAQLLPQELALEADVLDLERLSRWAVELRYPGSSEIDRSERDVDKLHAIAQAIVDEIAGRFSGDGV